MFKKSLLALALAGVATSATAVQIDTVTAKTASVEGLTLSTAVVSAEANAVVLHSGAEYSLGDIITIDITGGEFDIAKAPYALNQTTTAANASTVTFGPILTSKTQLKFRVTAVTAGTTPTTVGNKFTLTDTAGTGSTTNLSVNLTTLAKDAKVSITAKTTIGATTTVIDATANDSATLFTGHQEYAVTATAKNAQVDVSALRKAFVTAPVPTVGVVYTAATIAPVDFANYNVALTGDLTGVASVQYGATATDVLKIAADKQSAAVDFVKGKVVTGGAVNVAFNLPTKAADKVALVAPQKFALSLTGKDTSGNYKILDAKEISSWTLNGDSEFVEFVPFQAEYARSVTVTNNGTVEGEITAELFADGKMVASAVVGTASKYAVTDISAALNKLAADNGIEGFAGVRVTTGSPDANISVSAVYYHIADQDRVKVN